MAKDPTARIRSLKASFQATERKRSELTGRKEALMEQLRRDYKVSTIEDAERLADDMAKELQTKTEKLETLIGELEELAQ